MPAVAPWDMNCQALLLWLSREEWSLRGECDGAVLNKLIDQGLAKVLFPASSRSSEGIALTEMGWAQVARIQERARMAGG